jgi:hypothetical protein
MQRHAGDVGYDGVLFPSCGTVRSSIGCFPGATMTTGHPLFPFRFHAMDDVTYMRLITIPFTAGD